MTTIIIPDGYAWVCFFNALICLGCVVLAFYAGGSRNNIYTETFFKENFKDEVAHDATLTSSRGYPDMGSGYYSNKLTHEQWKHFNSAQRVHQNLVENIAIVLVSAFITGLVSARWTVLLQMVYFAGRMHYSWNYAMKGPAGRSLGAKISHTVMIIHVILSVFAAFYLGGGITGFFQLLFLGK